MESFHKSLHGDFHDIFLKCPGKFQEICREIPWRIFLKFHELFRKSQGNFMELSWNFEKFHDISWNLVKFHFFNEKKWRNEKSRISFFWRLKNIKCYQQWDFDTHFFADFLLRCQRFWGRQKKWAFYFFGKSEKYLNSNLSIFDIPMKTYQNNSGT